MGTIGVSDEDKKGPKETQAGGASLLQDSGKKMRDGEAKDKPAKALLAPVAIILRADHRSEPGTKSFLVGMETRLAFRCGSYDPNARNDGSPTLDNIVRRRWTLRSPDGSVRSLGSSPPAEASTEVTFTATRAGTYKLRLEVGDDDADLHRKGQAEVSIEVVEKCPVPQIQLPLDFIPKTKRFNSAIPVVGDHIVAHSLSHDQGMPPGKGISEAKWRIEPAASAMVLHSDRDRITFVPEEEGLYKVFLRVINENGVTSSDEAMVGQAIRVPMTPENLGAFVAEKIEELGFEAGVEALFSFGKEIGAPVALLLTLSTKAVDEGIKRMGLHPIIAIAIASGVKITSYGKVFWNIKNDIFYLPFKDLLAERIAGIRAFKLIDENSRDTHGKFAKAPAAQASLDVAREFFRKKVMEAGIKVDESC